MHYGYAPRLIAPMMNRMHAGVSRWYYANRARCGAIPPTDEVAERERLSYSADAVRFHQLQRLRTLLEHAGRHVPYYRDLFANCGFDYRHIGSTADLRELPILTKSDI